MKRFKFRLDPVIRYREYRERIAQIELARETQALIETKNRISEIEQTRRYAASELDGEQKEGIEVDRYRVFTAYLRGLRHEIESESERLVEIGKRIREKQEISPKSVVLSIIKNLFQYFSKKRSEPIPG